MAKTLVVDDKPSREVVGLILSSYADICLGMNGD